MSDSPLPNGSNGRASSGRFAKGNPGGPGNPLAATTARLRVALVNTVTEDDIQQIVRKLVEEAKSGNIAAARELLQRTLGDAFALDIADSHIQYRVESALED